MNISNNIYKASRPLPTHWRKATCQEVDCEQYLLGWQTIVDITTDLGKKQYNYIVNSSGRKGSGNQKGNLVTFTFTPEQNCFKEHKLPLERNPILTVQNDRGSMSMEPTQWKDHLNESIYKYQREVD